jgi:hypothetical protein
VNRGIRRSRAKALAIVLAAILSAGTFMSPVASSLDGPTSSRADYGIFDRISKLNTEADSRADDPEVASRVKDSFSAFQTSSYTFDDREFSSFTDELLTVPAPILRTPVVFDALKGNPIVNNTGILDWILPPPASTQGAVNYIVLCHHGDRNTFYLGSMVPRIGLFVDSSLDKWVYVDIDGDGTDDLRARMTFARDLLQRNWEVTILPPSITFKDAGLRLEIDVLDPSTDLGGSLYFIKGISYGGKNYIWSVGFAMDPFTDLSVQVRAKEWRVRPDIQGLANNFSLQNVRLLQIFGPYNLSYSFPDPPEAASILISVMRLQDRTLQDRAYVRIDLSKDRYHSKLVPQGKLLLLVDSTNSPIEGLEWFAGGSTPPRGNDTIELALEYAEFGTDIINARIDFPVMPSHVKLGLSTYQEGGKNVTQLDLITEEGIQELRFLEVVYPDIQGRGTSYWMATSVRLLGIPPNLRVITTTSVAFSLDDGQSSIGTIMLDALMNQVAGRFYRIGKILREIPSSILNLPSTKGWSEIDCQGKWIESADFVYTYGPYLNSKGNFIAFDRIGEKDAISGRIEDIYGYKGRFTELGNSLELRLKEGSSVHLLSREGARRALVALKGIPKELSIQTSQDGIEYSAVSELGSLEYRYRDNSQRFDANIGGVPSSLTLERSGSGIGITSGNGSIGTIVLFASNSPDLRPMVMEGDDNIAATISGGKAAFALHFTDLESLTYDNSSAGFIEIESRYSNDLSVIVDDTDVNMSIRAVLSPLPLTFHLDFPEVVEKPKFDFPDLTNIADVYGYAEIILSISRLADALLTLSTGISRGLTNAIGQYSSGLNLSWDLSRELLNMDLLIEIDKKGLGEVPRAHWTHGIWMEQSGMGADSSVHGRIFLGGMPTKGMLNLSFGDDAINAEIDFKGYKPSFDWLLLRTAGVQDRDISMYITGLSPDIDLYLKTNITTDLSIGGEMTILMDASIRRTSGGPAQLGEILATLTKATPILSVRQMYLPSMPSEFHLKALIRDGVKATYSSSDMLEYLYFKLTKLLDGRWSHVYAIFHDLPRSFSVDLLPNRDFSANDPFPLQGLPLLDLRTSSSTLDLFVEYDGAGFGQRGRFQITAYDMGNTTTGYEGADYVLDSDGIGFLSIDVGKLPVMESFTLESLSIIGYGIEHLRISLDMVFGLYPVIGLKDTQGGFVQLRLASSLSVADRTYDPNLFFISVRSGRVLGIPIVTGLAVTRDTAAVDMQRSSGSLLLPAPILSAWYYLYAGIFGGG